ncbi:hypothetical protein [Streptococcus sp. DD12]|nr:hypothetical protein [Streptococcus sp. DD12]KXT75834.1 hypothetical protein STRDD12_00946 [Streptococcus sp. DD12]
MHRFIIPNVALVLTAVFLFLNPFVAIVIAVVGTAATFLIK